MEEEVEFWIREYWERIWNLYYIHRIDEKVPIEETAGAMKELIEQGKITHWGLSEANEEIIRRAHKICPVTAIQNRYSMMYRDYETLFPVLEELNIGFVAFSPLANGFLTGKYDQNTQFEKTGDYRKVMPQFSEEGIRENEKLTEDETFTISATGTDVKSVTQNLLAAVSGTSAPTGASFDIKA